MRLMRIASARRARWRSRKAPLPPRAHGNAGPGESLAGASLRRAWIALRHSLQQHMVAPPDRAPSWIESRTRDGLRFSSHSPSDWWVVARAAQDQKEKPASPVQRAKRAIPVRRARLARRVRKGTPARPDRPVHRQQRWGRCASSVQAARPRPAPRLVTRMRCWSPRTAAPAEVR